MRIHPEKGSEMVLKTIESESKERQLTRAEEEPQHDLFLCLDGLMKQIPIAISFVICLVHLVSEGAISKIWLIFFLLESM